MPVSPQDFVLYSRETGTPLPRTPEEKMRMAPAVADFARNYAKAPSKLQEKGQSFAKGLKTLGTMGLFAGLGLGTAAAFKYDPDDNNGGGGGGGLSTSSDNYGQDETENQTTVELLNRGDARNTYAANYKTVATGLSEKQGLTDNPPSDVPPVKPDSPKSSVGPKSSGARPTIVRNAAEDFARNFLVQRGVQEASEPSVYFGEDMEPGSPEPGIKESGAVTYGGKSGGIQAIRALPEGGFGVQYQAYVPKGDKPYKGKPNYQYDATQTPSQPKVPEGVRTYGTGAGNQYFNVGAGKKSMSPSDYEKFEEKMDESHASYLQQEMYEDKARQAIKEGKVGTKGGIRSSDFVKAVMSGNYSTIFPDDDGPNLNGGGPKGNIPPSPTDTPDAGPDLIGGGKDDSYDFTDNSPQGKNFTSRRGDQIVDKANIEKELNKATGDDPWFDEGQKRMEDAERGEISDKGAERLFNRMDELGAREDKKKAPKSKTQRAEDLLNKMNKGREGDMAQDGPNKPSYDAKQRIAKKTRDKRTQKTNPLSTLDKALSKKQPENPIARGAQNLMGTGEVIGDVVKRGVEDTQEVLGNVTDRAKNFVRNQEIEKADRRFKDAGLPNFKQALDREREIKDNLNKGGAGLTPEQKSEAIRKMMIDEGYGDYLS